MTEVTTAKPARRSWALIGSICLNVALIAMILAAVGSMLFHRGRPWEGGPLGIHAMLDVATPAERAKIEAIVERHHGRLQDLSDRARATRRSAYQVFAQPNFDRTAYTQALDNMRAADDALKAEVGGMMGEAAAELSPEERQQLAARAERRSKWRMGHSHHHFW